MAVVLPCGARSSARTRGARGSHGSSKTAKPIWLGSIKLEEFFMTPILELVPECMEDDEDVLLANHLEAVATSFESEGNFVRAAECLRQAVDARRTLLGEYHPELRAAAERCVSLSNTWGILKLETGQHMESIELLKTAEAVSRMEMTKGAICRPFICAATFNNLCCYCRARGKLPLAVQYAEKAMKIAQRQSSWEHSSLIHLNYAVLLSCSGRHAEALRNLEYAIAGLTQEDARPQVHGLMDDVGMMLSVAYHNTCIELESLSRSKAALDYLQQAVRIAKMRLGESHALTLKIEAALQARLTLHHRSEPVPERPRCEDSDDVRLPTLLSPGSKPPCHRKQSRCKTAVDELAQTGQITTRFVPPPLGPSKPSQQRRQPRQNTLQCFVKDTYRRRQRFQAGHANYVGSAHLQQLAHGAVPMRQMRDDAIDCCATLEGESSLASDMEQKAQASLGPQRLDAILAIQKDFKHHRTRNLSLDKSEGRVHAATRIQAVYRGYTARCALEAELP